MLYASLYSKNKMQFSSWLSNMVFIETNPAPANILSCFTFVNRLQIVIIGIISIILFLKRTY
jgi:hypothetical protein